MTYADIYENYVPGLVSPEGYTGLSRWFVFHAGKLLVGIADGAAEIPVLGDLKELGVDPLRKLYLGLLYGQPCYAVEAGSGELAGESGEKERFDYRELRSLFGLLPDDVFLLAGRASQLLYWDGNNLFCGRCGRPMEAKTDERAKLCPTCGYTTYPRISPAVITAILNDGRILLAHARHFRNNMYSLIAGFVEPGETLEDCVRREIAEEVGIRVRNIRYFASQPWPFPDSLMIGFTADYDSGEIAVDGVEIGDAGWYDSKTLPELPSGASIARRIIDWYRENY